MFRGSDRGLKHFLVIDEEQESGCEAALGNFGGFCNKKYPFFDILPLKFCLKHSKRVHL